MTIHPVVRPLVSIGLRALSPGCLSGDDESAADPSATSADPAPTSSEPSWPLMTSHGACGALFIYSHNEEETHAVTVDFLEATDGDFAAGFTAQIVLPDPAVRVRLLQGEQLAGFFCNGDGRQAQRIDEGRSADDGTVAITVEAGVIEVRELWIGSADGTTVEVEPFTTQIGPAGG